MSSSNKTAATIVIVFFLGLFLLFFVFPNIDNIGDLFDNVNPTKITASDVTLDSEQGVTNLYLLLRTDYDAEWIEVKLELMDSNGSIIGSETKRFDNLESNETYRFKYSMSLTEILTAKTYRFTFIDGKRA